MVKALCSKKNMGHTKLHVADRATRFKTQTFFHFFIIISTEVATDDMTETDIPPDAGKNKPIIYQ